MFQFTYKLKITERIKAKCERHPSGETLPRRGPPGVSKKSYPMDESAPTLS